MSIGTLSARILMDASGVKSGLGLTRAEMRLTRQAFIESATDAEKLEAALKTLESARDKGAFQDEEQYAAAVAAVRQQLDPAVQAERDLATAREEAAQRGKALADSLATAEEKRAARLTEANDLLAQGAISQETYNRALAQMDAEKWQEMGTSIRNAGAATAAVAGGVTAGLTMIGKDLLDFYGKQEGAERKLQAAMSANATYTDSAFESYKAFASEMQRLTVFGDEAVLPMLQMAESLGVSGEAAERATKNAIGMSSALGINAESAMKMTTALEQGNTTLLTRYLPALRAIEDPAQRAAAAQEALGRMFGVAEAEAQTYAGAAAQLSNAWGDVKEEFGAVLAVGLMPVLEIGKDVVQWLGELDDGTKQTIVYVGLATAGLGAFVATGGAVVAACGQMVIWYGALQTSAVGAKVAQLALNSAVGVGYVAAAGAAFAAGYGVTTWLLAQTDAAKQAKAAYDEYAAGLSEIAKRDAKLRADALSAIDAAPASDRQALLTAELAKAQQQLDGLTGRAEMAREEMERIAPTWLSLGQAGKANWEAQKAEYEALKARAAEAGKFVNELDDRLRSAKAGTAIPAATDAVDKFTAKLQEQIATTVRTADEAERWKLAQQGATAEQLRAVEVLQKQAATVAAHVAMRQETYAVVDALKAETAAVGKTSDEVQRLELAAKGVSPEWLRVIEAMQQDLAGAKKAQAVREQVDQLTASLREQIATAGMSADEAERWRLQQQGATAEQLAGVAALQQQATAAKEAVEAKQAAETARQQQQQALQDAVERTTTGLREQIDTWGMDADEAAVAKLAAQGASKQQLDEVRKMQAELAALKRRKDDLKQTDVTIGATDFAGALDAIQQFNEAAPKAKPLPAGEKPEPIVAEVKPAWQPVPPAPPVSPILVPVQATWQVPPPPVPPELLAEVETFWGDIAPPPAAPSVPADVQADWAPIPPAPDLPPPVPADVQTDWTPIPPAPDVSPLTVDIDPVWSDFGPGLDVPPIAVDVAPNWQPAPLGAEPPQPGPGQPAESGPGGASQNRESLAWLEKIARGVEALVEKEGVVVEEVRL